MILFPSPRRSRPRLEELPPVSRLEYFSFTSVAFDLLLFVSPGADLPPTQEDSCVCVGDAFE